MCQIHVYDACVSVYAVARTRVSHKVSMPTHSLLLSHSISLLRAGVSM